MKEFLIQDNVSLFIRNRTREAIALQNACASISVIAMPMTAELSLKQTCATWGRGYISNCTGPTSTYGTRKWDSEEGQGIIAEGGRSA